MKFRIEYAKFGPGEQSYKTLIRIGGIEKHGAPQNIEGIYCDLYVNTVFISKYNSSSLFWCNEPLINIKYEDDCIIFFSSKLKGSIRVNVSEKINIHEFVFYLRGMRDTFSSLLSSEGRNVCNLNARIEKEISDGVYDLFRQK